MERSEEMMAAVFSNMYTAFRQKDIEKQITQHRAYDASKNLEDENIKLREENERLRKERDQYRLWWNESTKAGKDLSAKIGKLSEVITVQQAEFLAKEEELPAGTDSSK